MSQKAIAQMKKEDEKLKTVTEKIEWKVKFVAEEEWEHSEEGLYVKKYLNYYVRRYL